MLRLDRRAVGQNHSTTLGLYPGELTASKQQLTLFSVSVWLYSVPLSTYLSIREVSEEARTLQHPSFDSRPTDEDG